MLCERAADARVSTPTSTRTGHTTRPHATGHITAAAHPAPPAGYVLVPHTAWHARSHPGRLRRPRERSLDLETTAEPPPTSPPTPPLEPPPPPLLPPPPPEAAAQLPADVLEDVGWLAPQKRRLDVRIHRSRQPTRGRSPRSASIVRSAASRPRRHLCGRKRAELEEYDNPRLCDAWPAPCGRALLRVSPREQLRGQKP